MSRSSRTGAIVTTALFAATRKHERLTRFLEQGQARANLRAAQFARDQKAREIQAQYALTKTSYSGINRIKRQFSLGRKRDTIVERVISVTGIPLKEFGAKPTPQGVQYMIERGRRQTMRSAFEVKAFDNQIFTRRGRGRGPLRMRYGPGVAQMSTSPEATEAGASAYLERVEREVRKEEDRAYQRAGFKS